MEKPYFLKRLAGYLIDITIVFLIQIIIMSAVNIGATEYRDLSEKQEEILSSVMKGEEEALEEFKENNYKISKNEYHMINSATNMVIVILYFGIFAVFNEGRTIGKQILKYKVVKEDSLPANYVQMIIRAIIIYGIIFTTLNLIGVHFMEKENYFFYSGIADILQTSVVIVSTIMILFRNDGRGLHDFLTKTKVISLK